MNETTPIVILGTGGHAKVVIEIIEAMGGYEIVGLLWADTNPERLVCGYPIVGDDNDWERLVDQGVRHAAIGFGGWTENGGRRDLYERAVTAGFEISTCIHPNAYVAPSASIGRGSVVFPGVTVHTEVTVGENAILATGCTVDHESSVGSHVLLSAGVTVGAHARIGDGSLVALGAKVISRVAIGENALVGAGAVVVKDVPAATQVFGVPAVPR